MTDQASTLFDQNANSQQSQTADATVATTTTVDQTVKAASAVDINAVYADQLSAIKNEEGSSKYTNVTDALHALKASQEHIGLLERENATYKEQATQNRTAEDILELLDSKKAVEGESLTSFPTSCLASSCIVFSDFTSFTIESSHKKYQCATGLFRDR